MERQREWAVTLAAAVRGFRPAMRAASPAWPDPLDSERVPDNFNLSGERRNRRCEIIFPNLLANKNVQRSSSFTGREYTQWYPSV